MSKLVLYGTILSPPVRACLLTLKALELPYEFQNVELTSLEHMTPEFVKHNPQHTVPVLDDGGTWIWDSHAICAYLVGKYGKSDSLYPKDLAQRAVVDQRMYFDASVLFMAMRSVTVPLLRKNITVVMKEKSANIVEGYSFVEKFLGDNPYITGDNLTIADFCCCATVTSLSYIVEVNVSKFPNLHGWLERMSKLPYYEAANGQGVKLFGGFVKSKLTEIIM